jgi:hypothetical protein
MAGSLNIRGLTRPAPVLGVVAQQARSAARVPAAPSARGAPTLPTPTAVLLEPLVRPREAGAWPGGRAQY